MVTITNNVIDMIFENNFYLDSHAHRLAKNVITTCKLLLDMKKCYR